jgi:23S rRNA (cytosine1962-C5)-methyltransferase
VDNPKIILRRGKEGSLERRHPWVFSGAIYEKPAALTNGSVVEVWSSDKRFLGMGHYQSGGSIAVRIFSFTRIEVDENFWKKAIGDAIVYRKQVGLPSTHTNAYRLIHGEGDHLPGLIVDIYASIAVVQVHSYGMYLAAQSIADAIVYLLSDTVDTVYLRCKETMPGGPSLDVTDTFLHGARESTPVLENGVTFSVNVVLGQKTGFFLDQRDNRQLVAKYSQGNTVLNCFCYTGGFSIYALMAGATSVTSVDISQKAMDQLAENLTYKNFSGQHSSVCDNVMPFLSNPEVPLFDIVIVDPPAFAKSLQKRHNAVQAYKRLNQMAMKKVRHGGMLFTFSCSQVVGTQLFYDTIVAAGIESGKKIRVVQQLSQGADHPVQLFHPEGHYLKGLLLYLEDNLPDTP